MESQHKNSIIFKQPPAVDERNMFNPESTFNRMLAESILNKDLPEFFEEYPIGSILLFVVPAVLNSIQSSISKNCTLVYKHLSKFSGFTNPTVSTANFIDEAVSFVNTHKIKNRVNEYFAKIAHEVEILQILQIRYKYLSQLQDTADKFEVDDIVDRNVYSLEILFGVLNLFIRNSHPADMPEVDTKVGNETLFSIIAIADKYLELTSVRQKTSKIPQDNKNTKDNLTFIRYKLGELLSKRNIRHQQSIIRHCLVSFIPTLKKLCQIYSKTNSRVEPQNADIEEKQEVDLFQVVDEKLESGKKLADNAVKILFAHANELAYFDLLDLLKYQKALATNQGWEGDPLINLFATVFKDNKSLDIEQMIYSNMDLKTRYKEIINVINQALQRKLEILQQDDNTKTQEYAEILHSCVKNLSGENKAEDDQNNKNISEQIIKLTEQLNFKYENWFTIPAESPINRVIIDFARAYPQFYNQNKNICHPAVLIFLNKLNINLEKGLQNQVKVITAEQIWKYLENHKDVFSSVVPKSLSNLSKLLSYYPGNEQKIMYILDKMLEHNGDLDTFKSKLAAGDGYSFNAHPFEHNVTIKNFGDVGDKNLALELNGDLRLFFRQSHTDSDGKKRADVYIGNYHNAIHRT